VNILPWTNFGIQSRAVISGLVEGYKAGVRLVAEARYYLARLRHYSLAALQAKETVEVAIEFFTEAAVLIAVFPILDTVIPIGNTGGIKNLTWALVLVSEGIALLFFILAIILAGVAKDRG
jgi:hypothetical protein